MADRSLVQQTILGHVSKMNDPDADLRYMSLNDLHTVLTNSNSSFLSSDHRTSAKLVEGLMKALDDQHGDVQNQALKWYTIASHMGPLAVRIPFEALVSLLEQLCELTNSQTIDTSVPHTAIRAIVATLPRPQAGQPPSQPESIAYQAVSKVLIPKLIGPSNPVSGRRASVARGMLEKDPSRGFSSDAIDVLIKVVTCFGPLLSEYELAALQDPIMVIIHNDTAGTVVTKRALAAISALVLYFSDVQLNNYIKRLTDTLSSPNISTVHRRHLIAAIGVIARNAPAKIGPHLDQLAPYVFAALGDDGLVQGK
ncbi:Cullin-associated NEDD8-dissociated protein 1N-terminal part [Penicillium diatomitis]|uniref:Cullin-associated NEDD8-dissociated protein 1N-terminal part n=1 Tax=Penicillium diatomitis TaxID=2819901 RepID=A0A9W9XC69_9EURO|nr:Cullin-associated NEDD8-dissociated protein 1N-terminal part [Penicillium diatomitis]KAJ5488616.1 Cullin-associated NEDD8-dissociated protein 1N-terminal part [Penicillium diatomitis]